MENLQHSLIPLPMKNLLMICFLVIGSDCIGQSNYFKMYNDSIYTQSQFDTYLNKKLPVNDPVYIAAPTIYHKQYRKDSVINYFTIVMTKSDHPIRKSGKIDIVYKQDPLYLILDKKLPEFKLRDLDDKVFNSSQLIGKPTLINFWSIQCAPCIQEFPELDKLREKYEHKINFISISENSKSQVKELLKRKPFHFYHLVNGYDYKTNVLKVSSLPSIIFLDKNGYVVEIKGGIPYVKDKKTGKPYIARFQFEKILDKLIKL